MYHSIAARAAHKERRKRYSNLPTQRGTLKGVMETHPIMIVRARLDPGVLDEFETWHRETHLPHVLEIPGIVSAFRVRGQSPIAGSHLMGYAFESESAVQPALSSKEAQQARRDWERWADQVYELSVEIYAPLAPLPIFQHQN